MKNDMIAEICQLIQTGIPLGGDKFKNEIESLLGVKVGHSARGRPRPRKIIKGTDPF